jgi:hypothetical protein
MIPGVPTLGIRFDIGKIDSGDYGGFCWKTFWRAVNIGKIRGATLFEGDTYSGNVYCIAVQIANAAVFDEIEAALERNEDFGKIAASPRFVRGGAVTSEPLIGTGQVDASDQLVGGINSGAALKAVLAEKRDAPQVLPSPETGDVQGMSDADRILEGHTGEVKAVAITPDGARIVSGSSDKTVRVWGLRSGHLERILEGHTGEVKAVAITPDGARIVSGSSDKTVRVWDLRSGHLERILEGHTDEVLAVAITPDGARIVSGGQDEAMRVWNLDSGRPERTLKGFSGLVSAVAITPDGARIVSGSWDNTVRVWNLASGRIELARKGPIGYVWAVAITPDGASIVSGWLDTPVRVWDLAGVRPDATLEGNKRSVWALAVTHDGNRVISGGLDHTVRVWDLKSGRLEGTLEGHTGSVNAVAVTAEGDLIVSGGDKSVRVWVAPAQSAAPMQVPEPAPTQPTVPVQTPAVVPLVWMPTHLAPPGGMAAWDAPDPSRPPVVQLAEQLELVVESSAGAWTQVRAVNGWRGWVDGRLLIPRL